MAQQSSDITVRKGVPQDAETIAQFNVNMASETEDTKLDKDTVKQGALGLMQNPHYGFYLIAESAGAVIGSLMITFEWTDWRNGLFWWIQSVYIDPQWRRKGVFSSLYQKAENLAKNETNVRGLRLYVDHENQIAQSTYQSLGMKKTNYQFYEIYF